MEDSVAYNTIWEGLGGIGKVKEGFEGLKGFRRVWEGFMDARIIEL